MFYLANSAEEWELGRQELETDFSGEEGGGGQGGSGGDSQERSLPGSLAQSSVPAASKAVLTSETLTGNAGQVSLKSSSGIT